MKEDKKKLSKRERVLMDPKLYYTDKKVNKTPNTLQDQAWKRALENSKPNAGTPHDWEDYERQQDSEE